MSKTLSGSLFIGGAFFVWLIGSNIEPPPMESTIIEDIRDRYIPLFFGLIGVGVCFFGAMRFSRGN